MKKRKKMLPKKNVLTGLYLFCNKHKKWYKHDKDNIKCDCKLVYKAKIHVPGTKNKSRYKNFEAETIEDALIIFNKFRKDVIQAGGPSHIFEEKKEKPIFITDCQEKFMEYIKDIGVPFQERRHATNKVIRHYERCLEYFNEALVDNNIRPHLFKFEHLNPTIVGSVMEHFLEKREMANKTFNNNIAPVKAFATYIIKEYYPDVKNPFEGLKKLSVQFNKFVITKAEFTQVISLVSPENILIPKVSLKRDKITYENCYRKWLIDGYYMKLLLGVRNEEVTNLRWSDIKVNEVGEILCFKIVDYKRTRRNKFKSKLEKDNLIIKHIEIVPELEDMLKEFGYEDKKGSDEYILAPEETNSRLRMSHILSRSFNYLIKKLNLAEEKGYNNLRKTYATRCYLSDPENFWKKMGHTNKNTTLNHYVDMGFVMEERRKRLLEETKKAEEKAKKRKGRGKK